MSELFAEKVSSKQVYTVNMVIKQEVMEVLKTINDPEIGIDVVNLCLAHEIKITGHVIDIKMMTALPLFPITSWVLSDVQRKVEELEGVSKCNIELFWNPPWTPDMISDEARKMLNIDGKS